MKGTEVYSRQSTVDSTEEGGRKPRLHFGTVGMGRGELVYLQI